MAFEYYCHPHPPKSGQLSVQIHHEATKRRRHLRFLIVIPRLEDVLDKISVQLEENPRFLMATRRLVLAGGGAGLQGIKEKTEDMLRATVRLGRPSVLKGLPTQFDSYTFSTCIGLVKYAMIRQKSILSTWQASDGQKGQKNSRIRKVMQWLSQNF